jgi:hypothetical protein
MFDNGKWGFPENEGPVQKDGRVFIPVNREGKLEPIQTGEEFGRLYALFNEEIFLGNLNRDAISIGLENIKFNEDKFRDSISNILKDLYPSIYKGLNNNKEALENLIDDIETRSMRSLLNSIIIPRLKKYRRASLENSWNNSGLLPSQSRELKIHTPPY